jgi:toxin ParE1/3/4
MFSAVSKTSSSGISKRAAMAYRVVFRPAAERDLDNLYRHIRDQRGDPGVAIVYIRRIRDCCESLRDFPERGVKRDDIRPGLRILGFERRVAIAFVVDGDSLRIGRIFYGGRDYEALLSKGG